MGGFVDDYLAYLLARASHLISSEFHAVVQASGISLMEWRVMASLSGKEALSIGELADIVLARFCRGARHRVRHHPHRVPVLACVRP
jgi:hypothetical protein